MRGDRLGFLLRAAREGDVVRLRFGPFVAHLLTHPDQIRAVLADRARAFGKHTRGFRALRLLLGNGLLTSEGEFWLRQRRIAQPSFHRDRIAGFAQAMTRAADDAASRLLAAGERGGRVDASAEMMRLTLRIVGETLLGADVSGESDRVGQALAYLLEDTNRRINLMLDIPLSWPLPRNRRYLASRGELDGIVRGLIEARRRAREPAADLLSMLMEARDDETGQGMDDEQLRDEVMTMFLAGHETTANALSWTLALLSSHPWVEARLRDELAGVLGGRAPTLDDLPKLRLGRMVLKESMRLYPPAWMIGRAPVQDELVAGFRLPKDSLVFVSPYVTHRHPAFWDNPEGFDPERFTPEREAARPKFAYFPFGGGPRQCIGSGFAQMEAELLLATLLSRCRFALVPGHPVEPEPLVTLRPRHGLLMTVRPA